MALDEEVENIVTQNTPEQAASNIQKAESENYPPDAYVELEKDIQDVPKAPIRTSKPVANVMRESAQHNAALKGDVEKLNWAQRQWDFFSKSIQGNDIGAELFEIQTRAVHGQELTIEDKFRVSKLNSELKELNGGMTEYNYNFTQSLPAQAVTGIYDLTRVLGESYDEVIAGTLIGGGGGALIGMTTLTPLGVAAGALYGAQTGFGVGLTAGLVKGAYQQTVGQIYNDLSFVIPETKELPELTKRRLAVGAGILSGAVSLLPIGAAAKSTPFFKRLINSRSLLKHVVTAEGAVLKQALMRMGTTGAAEGVEEAIQEVIQIVATETGKTWDGTETSFVRGWSEAVTKIETLEQAGKAAVIGGIVGSAVQVGLSAADVAVRAGEVEAPKTDLQIDPEVEPTQVVTSAKGVRAIQLKVGLDQAVELTKDTTTRQMLPEKMDQIRKQMYDDAGTAQVWVDKEELSAWADSDEKAALARELIGPDGIAAAQLDSPLRIEMHKFIKIAEDHPEITNLVKADSTGPSFMAFSMRMKKAGEQRKQILGDVPGEIQQTNIDVMKQELQKEVKTQENKIKDLEGQRADVLKSDPEFDTSELDNLIANETAKSQDLSDRVVGLEDIGLEEIRIRDEDISNEESYLEQQTFTKDMDKILPPDEILRLNEAETTARIEVADSIAANVEKETEKVVDLRKRFQTMFEEESLKTQVESTPRVLVVEDFMDNSRVIDPTSLDQVELKLFEKGKPVHAINPELLSDRLKVKYADDPVLKIRKVFRKDGMRPEDVVGIYDAESVESFLETMAKTPTTEEKISNDLNELEEDLRFQLQSERGEIEDSSMAKAYDRLSRLHLKSAKILRDKFWPVYREGIKRVALDIPKLQKQLQKQAKEIIGATKIKDLNINRWSVAQRRSQTKSVTSYLKGRLEEGFRQKQNAAQAAQLQKETRIANSKVNKALQFITRLSTPRYQQVLKGAKGNYHGAAQYILDVYNFHPSEKNQGEIENFQKYAKDMVDRGEGDQSISPEVLQWLTPKENHTALTVDQLLHLEDKLRTIYKKAQLKNRMLRKDETRTIEMIADAYHDTALGHSKYDVTRNDEPQGAVPLAIRFFESGLDEAETKINNNQFMTLELDDGVTNGPSAKLFHDPIKGTGQYEGPTGLVADAKLRGEYSKRFAKGVKTHFKNWTEFKNFSVDVVTIPEFAQLPAFKKAKGKLTKHDLLMMLANMGNDENRAYVENYGIDPDEVMTILKRELGENVFDFVQDAFWNAAKTIAPRIDAVERSTTGKELDFTIPESFQAFGKNYEGGHFPIILKRDGKKVDHVIETSLDALGKNPLESKSNSTYGPSYDGIVRSPHTKARKGSEYLLDLDMERYAVVFDDMIYDITMREPIRDVMTLVRDPRIKEDMISIIGKVKYDSFAHNLADITRSASATRLQIHNDSARWLMNLHQNVESSFTAAYVAFNPKSVLMSTMAFPQIAMRMGPKNFTKYMGKMSRRLLANGMTFNTEYFKQLYDLASDIDPSLQNARQGIEDFSRSSIDKMTLKKRVIAGPKVVRRTYSNLRRLQEGAYDISLSGILGGLDTIIKTMTTGAVYDMYLNGDAKGHDLQSVRENKTLEDIDRNARAFTGQFLDGTTMRSGQYDKAVLQKLAAGRMFTKFWNELRSQLNNYIDSGRNVQRDAKKMGAAFEAGNHDEALAAFQGSRNTIFATVGIMLASKAMLNQVTHGTAFIGDEPDDPDDIEGDFFGFLEYNLLDNPVGLAAETIGAGIPAVKDIYYSMPGKDRPSAVPRYNVSVPLLAAATDVATAIGVPGQVNQIMIEDGLTFWESIGELDYGEFKGLLAGTSYFIGGVPGINQIAKFRRAVEDEEIELPNMNFINQNFLKNVDEFLHQHDDTPEQRFERAKRKFQGKETKEDALVEELKSVRNALRPLPEGEVLSPEGYQIIKHAESNGKWRAQAETSSAFGIYQFTSRTWKNVMALPGGEELTLNGRLQKNGKQQEKAMRILTKNNVVIMRRKKVPISIESIYFAHHFGPAHAADVYNVAEKTKLPKSLMTTKVLKANPRLVKTKVKTAGDMKKFIRWNLKRGEENLTKSGR